MTKRDAAAYGGESFKTNCVLVEILGRDGIEADRVERRDLAHALCDTESVSHKESGLTSSTLHNGQ